MPPLAVIAIVLIAVAFALVVSRLEGLGVFAPKRTGRINGTAQSYCVHRCQLSDGTCPLTRAGLAQADCPLWGFVRADLPTDLPRDPQEARRIPRAARTLVSST